jgi:hypothetical protein
MRIRTLTIMMALTLLLQGGGVMQAVHWMQADAEPACVDTDAHHDHHRDPGHAPSHHHHDHCAVCLAIAGIWPVSLDVPTVMFVESGYDQVVVESFKTPCFEAFSRHSGRDPPIHL